MWDKLIDIWEGIKSFFYKILPTKRDDQETKYFKITLFLIIGVFCVMVVVTFLVFFVSLKGEDQTKIPDVTSTLNNKVDLITAILTLQEKRLNYRIELKTSSRFGRGIVMEQNPNPGATVKMGRIVTLVVSKGPIITKIDDYTGKTLAWLRYELQGAFASNEKALVEIREPIMYQYDESETGTILTQSPSPGTPVNEEKLTYIDLVVSKGPKGKEIYVDKYAGLQFEDAIKLLAQNNIMMITEIDTEKNKYGEGIISAQNPDSGKEIPYNTAVKLKVNEVKRALSDDEVFGIYEYILERYQVPVEIRFIAKYKNEEQTLLSLKSEGGKISFPYVLKKGTEISVVLYEDRETDVFHIEADE